MCSCVRWLPLNIVLFRNTHAYNTATKNANTCITTMLYPPVLFKSTEYEYSIRSTFYYTCTQDAVSATDMCTTNARVNFNYKQPVYKLSVYTIY